MKKGENVTKKATDFVSIQEMLAINRFTWHNLPNDLDGQLLERNLYNYGSVKIIIDMRNKNMTEKEYYKWCKKFKKELHKKCKACKKAKNGAYGILCEHCINEAQMIIDKMKRKVLRNEPKN